MTIEEFFPARFCLNLDRRPDRKLRAWEQFRREGLAVERLPAPDAAEMGITETRGYEKIGPRACAAAHRLAWREARKQRAGAVLVFEDDVVLAQEFREKLEAWLRVVPGDWAMLYLGGVFRDPPELIAPGLLRVRGHTWDMHAYAVRAEVFSMLHRVVAPLSFRRERGRPAPSAQQKPHEALDTIIPHLHGTMPVYAPWPPLAWQPQGLSNTEIAKRGNYRKDGQQALMRYAVEHLPGAAK